mmetsp:Transcript_2088/g.3382  ORF Transcript_2088/g.3382 Transcript_2088/m.3382 type:complete len:285 (-) Transcript_2088:1148-2002(-)
MVEMIASPLDEDIPIVQASLVTIDGELTEGETEHVHLIPVADTISDGSSFPPSSFRSCSCSTNEESAMTAASAVYVTDGALSSPSSSNSQGVEFDFSQHCEEHQEQSQTGESCLSSEGNEKQERSELSGAAGAAGALLGLLMGGPFLSVVLGLGALYYADQEGAAGDISRAMGEVAIMARSRFRELDEKHHLLDKSKEAATAALAKLKEVERRHRAERRHKRKVKLQKFFAWCWKSFSDFERKHKLVEKTSTKLKEHLDSLVQRHIPDDSHQSPEPPDSDSTEQ